MITIPLFLVGALALSFIAWGFISFGIAVVFFFGEDTAFVKSSIVSAFIVLCFWLVYSGIIIFK